ncbi:hypothetical protein JX265_005323 [Neoarthrinium moseri]|uniref:Nuclear pore complex protein n=1 Tax=Neoarthrinium moseri TaxID=1658444 RepID=A0A9P9WNN3_9PEZI|nr:uncharacterized protein JN550_006220 [Neoarthrinium moseri]KAI1868645.1 hypothetical protein JN550_006220 [Neoarthrinium moseri]KAI1872443.1 hypothetical protein JX265_005323 [Neoarthrinium moseri]
MQRVSVTATGSFNVDEEMYDGDEYYGSEDEDVVEEDSEFSHDAADFAKQLDKIASSEETRAGKRNEIIGLVEAYYELAFRKLSAAHELQQRSRQARQHRSEDEYSQESMDVDEAEEGTISDEQFAAIEREVQTWDFLRRLLPLRYPERKKAQPKRREPAKFQTGAELWEEFLESDAAAQERKEILEVLQWTADESGSDIDDMVRDLQQNAERGDIIAYGWLHTRSAIKMQKNVHRWTGPLDANSADVKAAHRDSTGANPLVTQLDPDVVTRQGRKLQPQDEYFERAIWLGCYELLRRGRSITEIRDWCVERTEVWRAMSMSAMPLSKHPDEKRFSTNPLSMLLWRRTCYALARQGGSDDYERAVYGILSGDVKSVVPVCSSWDDHLFAQCNALLRSQFDAYILRRSPRDATQSVTQLPVYDAVQSHGDDAATVSESWFSALDDAEARTPIKSLQAAIISNTIDQYLYNEGLVLGQQANQKEPSRLIPDFNKTKSKVDDEKYFSLSDQNGLRILVHIYLLISSLEELEGGEVDLELRKAQENALAAYISTLRLNSLVDFLPLYCSKLQGDRAFYTLSRNVSMVVDQDTRSMLLRYMEKLGMNIKEFVVFQPQSLLKEFPENSDGLAHGTFKMLMDEPPSVRFGRRIIPDFLGETPDDLDPVEEQLIQSLEWMLLVDGLWDEIFRVGVAVYKRFLRSGNIHAAKTLSERVSCAKIFTEKARIPIQDEYNLAWWDEVANNEDDLVDENNNPRQLTTARNYLDLESLVRALDAMETVGATADLHLDPTFQKTADFFPTLGGHVKYVQSFMAPLLNKWLLESVEEDPDFELLRDMYLPEIIIGYVSVLHYAGTSLSRDYLLEAMELAAHIADKESDVAAVLMKSGRMREVVEAFANASKALAVSSEDKRKGGTGSSKKMRELGWSREVWSVGR